MSLHVLQVLQVCLQTQFQKHVSLHQIVLREHLQIQITDCVTQGVLQEHTVTRYQDHVPFVPSELIAQQVPLVHVHRVILVKPLQVLDQLLQLLVVLSGVLLQLNIGMELVVFQPPLRVLQIHLEIPHYERVFRRHNVHLDKAAAHITVTKRLKHALFRHIALREQKETILINCVFYVLQVKHQLQ